MDGMQKKVTTGLVWTFGERITAQLVTTIVTIVLARLLDPANYGVISIVTIFISFCDVFVSSGFGSAVVQRKDPDEGDFHTAFLISFSLAWLLYALLFFVAPLISRFYEMSELTLLIRVMALRLPIASINSIQQAYVQKEMAFRRFFIATLFGTVLSGFVGVSLAYYGFGVWALAGQYLTNTTVDTIVLWFVCGWTPRLRFSKDKAKALFSFGWKVLASNLVSTLENDIRSLLVGKVFGPADLAFYDQGKKYPSLLMMNINASINKVMLPAFSEYQDDNTRLKSMLRRSIQIGLFLLMPIMFGFFAVADSFVRVVLTDKWIAAVPFIRIFCLYFLSRPLETSCQQVILAKGKSGTVFHIMVIVSCCSIISVLIAVFVLKSVMMIAVGSIITTLVSILCYMVSTNRMIGYSVKEQFSDLLKPLLMSLLMVIAIGVVGMVTKSTTAKLIAQVITGIVVYIAAAAFSKDRTFKYLLQMIGKIIHR